MTQDHPMKNRRDFLQTSTLGLAGSMLSKPAGATTAFTGSLCLFSKHLPGMDWSKLAKTVKQLGFDGIDLTVRAAGHVLPEKAETDLPKAFKAIQDQELRLPMITTNLTSAADPTAKAILSTAGKLGIPYLKPGYYRYAFVDVRAELQKAMADFRGLCDLGKQSGVQIGYHNHEGYLGAQTWDVAATIDQLDAKWIGYYFDIRHAVAEGGAAGWKIALNLAAPRIKMIAIKDSYWDRTSKGWRQINCPLGEGAVDWKAYFKLLQAANFNGPISLHIEYDIKGPTPAAIEENTLVAIEKDFAFLKARLKETYG